MEVSKVNGEGGVRVMLNNHFTVSRTRKARDHLRDHWRKKHKFLIYKLLIVDTAKYATPIFFKATNKKEKKHALKVKSICVHSTI